MSIRTKRILKSSRGIALAAVFGIVSSLSTFAAVSSAGQKGPSSSVAPVVTVVDEQFPTELNSGSGIVFDDADMTAAIAVSDGVADSTEQYILAGKYQVCITSNSLVPVNSKSGVLLKITKSTSDTQYADSNSGSYTQMALYNSSGGGQKIRFILVMTPAGMTTNTDAFGASGSTTGSYSQVTATNFVIGADAAAGSTAAVLLNDADATDHQTSATNLENLILDAYGVVNHYGTSDDVFSLSDATTAANGLAAAENMSISGCTVDQNPSTDTASSGTTGLITFAIYANANDLAKASAGTYSTSYAVSYADADDTGLGTVYDDDGSI